MALTKEQQAEAMAFAAERENNRRLEAEVERLRAQVAGLEGEKRQIINDMRDGMRALNEAYDAVKVRYYPHPTTHDEYVALIALRERVAILTASEAKIAELSDLLREAYGYTPECTGIAEDIAELFPDIARPRDLPQGRKRVEGK